MNKEWDTLGSSFCFLQVHDHSAKDPRPELPSQDKRTTAPHRTEHHASPSDTPFTPPPSGRLAQSRRGLDPVTLAGEVFDYALRPPKRRGGSKVGVVFYFSLLFLPRPTWPLFFGMSIWAQEPVPVSRT